MVTDCQHIAIHMLFSRLRSPMLPSSSHYRSLPWVMMAPVLEVSLPGMNNVSVSLTGIDHDAFSLSNFPTQSSISSHLISPHLIRTIL